MRDEALKPFTDAMKDVVCHTIEEQFNQFSPSISASVTAVVRQENTVLKREIVQQVKHEVEEGLQSQAQAILRGSSQTNNCILEIVWNKNKRRDHYTYFKFDSKLVHA